MPSRYGFTSVNEDPEHQQRKALDQAERQRVIEAGEAFRRQFEAIDEIVQSVFVEFGRARTGDDRFRIEPVYVGAGARSAAWRPVDSLSVGTWALRFGTPAEIVLREGKGRLELVVEFAHPWLLDERYEVKKFARVLHQETGLSVIAFQKVYGRYHRLATFE